MMNRRVFVAGMALVALVTMLAGLPGGLTAQDKSSPSASSCR